MDHHLSDQTSYPIDSDSGIDNCSAISGNASTVLSAPSNSNSVLDLTDGHENEDSEDPLATDQSKSPPSDLNLSRNEAKPKSAEVDFIDERDTFSPVSSTGESSSEPQMDDSRNASDFTPISPLNGGALADAVATVLCELPLAIASEVDNKTFDRPKMKSTSSKEEKQRQNEEIAIMETSSISSETGSWESIFPVHPAAKIVGNDATTSNKVLPANTEIDEHPPAAPSSGCFIDASSLLDEEEIGYPHLPEVGCFGPRPETSSGATQAAQEKSPDKSSDSSSGKESWAKKLHLDKLEAFHKSFELCKTKKEPTIQIPDNSNSSSCCSDSPQKSEENTANNLSDEEKLLWKRKISSKEAQAAPSAVVDIKDQYDKESPSEFTAKIFKNDSSQSSGSGSHNGAELPEEEKQRREQERKQGSLVFQNNIQQFSGHVIRDSDPPERNSRPCGRDAWGTISEPTRNSWDLDRTSRFPTDYSSRDSSFERPNRESKNSFPTPSSRYSGLGGLEYDIDRLSTDFEHPNDGPCILPDTPHNSIVQTDPALSESRQSYHQPDSGMYNSDATDSPIMGMKIPKRSKCDESAPIVSGGASIKDFTPKQCESPPVKRKTETCPIMSGGFISLEPEPVEEKVREKSRQSKQQLTSWVVDMSDCKNHRRVSSSSSSSAENNTARSVDSTLGSAGSQKTSLGFYVSLHDMEPPKSLDSDSGVVSTSLRDSGKKSTGYYVDMSGSEKSVNATPPSGDKSGEKKLFSMFIDFSDKKPSPRPFLLQQRSSGSTSETEKPETPPVTPQVIKSKKDEEEPLSVAILRRNKPKDDTEKKRHSWAESASATASQANETKQRPLSMTGDQSLMKIIDKIPLIARTSNLSIDTSLSPFDEFPCSKSEMSTYSNNSNSATSASCGEVEILPKGKTKKRRKDAQINETFDKSSTGSLTEGIFSNKDLSPSGSTTDTDDLTFQQDDNGDADGLEQGVPFVPIRPAFMETIIEAKETASPKKAASTHTMESLHATIEKQKQLLETVNEYTESNGSGGSIFVKLSDMDRPVRKFELHSPEAIMSKSVGNHRQINRLFHDSKTRPHSWAMTRSTGNSIMNITNSVDNLRSLTRLFPHLSKELSNSLPNDMYNRSAQDLDYGGGHSDISAESSMASSFSRSGMDESSMSNRQPRRLGEDLLKMFLQEIATDVIVEVNGRHIKAHKCILRSRCQYFAAMLSGGWVQSAGNVISLAGYSYSAVHFALCHIYSGASHPPEGISLMELAALADLLCLEGLKEVTAHALKTNYCHNFHKPCSGCIDGILQVLPVALNHALDDLYRKCLKWTCRHYMKVWPSRAFAQLPNDILGRCRQQAVAHLTSETVMYTILDCDHLISQLAPCRWATVVENLVRDILDAAYGYVSDHFASLIASDSFLSLGHDKSSYISRLESVLLSTASSLTPDQACRSYQRITRLSTVLSAKVIRMPSVGEQLLSKEIERHEEDLEWNEEFIRLVNAICSTVEQCLIRQCSRAMRVTAWQRMDLELRKKIQALARLTDPLDLRRSASSSGKPVTKAFSFAGSSRNQDLYQVKLAIQAHSKKALAQDTQLYRPSTHAQANNAQDSAKDKSSAHGKILKTNSKANVPSHAVVQMRPKSITEKPPANLGHRRTQSEDSSKSLQSNTETKTIAKARLTEIRPRYLEPRRLRTGPLKSQTTSNVRQGKYISSSDSSRTSSPAARNNENNKMRTRIGTKSANMSLDSLVSPSRKADKLHLKQKIVDHEISIDSLAGSMKSSMKTDKTISQESLSSTKVASARHLQLHTAATNGLTSAGKFIAKSKSISCQNTLSTGSSPSSITTTKSSRISSVGSVNSPRTAFKNRSISVPANGAVSSAGQPTPTTGRKSFLSAKSREILARRAEKVKLQSASSGDEKSQSSAVVVAPVRPIKSSSVSNIPMRKTMPPTTLHLRKTAKLPVGTVISNGTARNKVTEVQNKHQKSGKNLERKNHIQQENLKNESSYEGNKFGLVIESPVKEEESNESRLKRSTTFSKEISDLPIEELQIVE